MAIFSLSTKPISRSGGRSAVAASAYRSGGELVDQRTGLLHDYTRKAGVVHAEIIAPQGISGVDREQLWNAAEQSEKRKDARVAREYLVALPHELDADQRLALARELGSELVERYGVAVDVAIHAPDRDGDNRNHHAHLLATTRRLNHDGLGDKASIELSDKKRKSLGMGRGADEVKLLRQRWETLANAALERADVASRIDCRSLADQGSQRVPQIHVGNYGTDMIRRGTPENSQRATLNLEIKAANAELHQLQRRAAQRAAEREAAEAKAKAEREAQAEAEWEQWVSRPEVGSDGRIITEIAVDEECRRSWEAFQREESEAEAKAHQEAISKSQNRPKRDIKDFELQREKERQAIESERPLSDRVREASAGVHKIDADIKRLDDERESTSFFKFAIRRELQARIDELLKQRRLAYENYAKLQSALDAEKAAEAAQPSARDQLRKAAAEIQNRKGAPIEPRRERSSPEPRPEKQNQPAPARRKPSGPSRGGPGF